MPQSNNMSHLNRLYHTLLARNTDNGVTQLDQSLKPRFWTACFDENTQACLTAESIVVDVGCGLGIDVADLSCWFGCQIIGIDLLKPPAFKASGGQARVNFVQATVQLLPLQTSSVDVVWCKDLLLHVKDVDTAVREFHRVLHSGGKCLVWVTTETELMEPRESEVMYSALAVEKTSLSRKNLEASFDLAGFKILRVETLGSEIAEFHEEVSSLASKDLMRIARMRRKRNELQAEWGETRYKTLLGVYQWTTYHLLGKLSSDFYLLEKDKATSFL